MNLELRIEELALHGFPPGDHELIGESVKRELSRLFTEHGVPPSLARGADVPRLDAGAFQMNQGLRAEAAGEQVACALYERLAQ
ncbi:MAG TPA: hypothetical protein VK869_08025 [Rubrobacteraceae bacterium]|nr:hypothetical protein [Rubrobacteraceae bacterium]